MNDTTTNPTDTKKAALYRVIELALANSKASDMDAIRQARLIALTLYGPEGE